MLNLLIPQEKIAEVRERTDLKALVENYVRLKRVGASFKGLCPFHSEKSPSFYVHPQRQFYHCFGCKASGDAIRFVKELEGLDFVEAVRTLAERAGVEIPEYDRKADSAYRQRRAKEERLVALMDATAGFFCTQLKTSEAAQEELDERGISADIAERFRLGYAPDAWDGLCNWLRKEGWSPGDAEALGLIVPRRSGRGYYDRFRHRLMFPVSDHQGRIVAFSGRLLATKEVPDEPGRQGRISDVPPAPQREPGAKYINSPESPLYTKGEVLFGLHEARVMIRREGRAIVCEGNFDLLALHHAGLGWAVCPLGTAFTAAHADRLKRVAEEVVLLFDGDAAGQKAVRAAYPMLQAAGLGAKVVTLPRGEDPDSFVRTRGGDQLQKLIRSAPGIHEYLIDEAAAAHAGDPRETAQAIEELGGLMCKIDSPVEARLYVERIAQKFGIADINAVRSQLRRGAKAALGKKVNREEKKNDRSLHTIPKNRVKPPRPSAGRLTLKHELVGALLDNPQLYSSPSATELESLLGEADATGEIDHGLLAVFRAGRDSDGTSAMALLDALGEQIDEDLGNWLAERLAVQRYDDDVAKQVLEEGVPRLRKQTIEWKLPALARQIQSARRQGNEALARQLTQEREELRRAFTQAAN